MPCINAEQLRAILANSAVKNTAGGHASLASKMATSTVYDMTTSHSSSSAEDTDDEDDYDLVTPLMSRRNSVQQTEDGSAEIRPSTPGNGLPSNNVGPFPHLANITPMPYAATSKPPIPTREVGSGYAKPASYISSNARPQSSLGDITPRPYDAALDGPVLSKVFTTSSKSTPIKVGWSTVKLPATVQTKPSLNLDGHSPSLPTSNTKLAYVKKADCSCWYCNGTDPAEAELNVKLPATNAICCPPSSYEEAQEDFVPTSTSIVSRSKPKKFYWEKQDEFEAPGCVALCTVRKAPDVQACREVNRAFVHSSFYEEVQDAYVASLGQNDL